jgi:PPK2 family polyphosphate:nucleotide phosphotransferase
MAKKALYEKYLVKPSKDFNLNSIETDDVQGWEKAEAKIKLAENIEKIDALQEQLYAEGKQALLVVIQAMDAAGKDSTIKELTNGLNPQGVQVTSFKVPSTEEKAHDFLWRVHAKAPAKGTIGIFNRSHYEEVLVVKVHGWADEELTEKHYKHINQFEKLLTDHGTRVLKIMLHISPEYQLEQFKERLEDPTKNWKFNPADLEERKLWKSYMKAFEQLLNECSTDYAPWYVIPSENKWFRTLTISELVLDTLKSMNPQYPAPTYNPADITPDKLV